MGELFIGGGLSFGFGGERKKNHICVQSYFSRNSIFN
jgi:hypothetical protein